MPFPQRYADVDADGKLLGFYSDDVPVAIPPSAVPITEENYLDWRTAGTDAYRWHDGGVAAYTPPPTEQLATARAAKQRELRAACEAAILGGCHSSALGAPNLYPTKRDDQFNMSASVIDALSGVSDAWTTPFWCADESGAWERRPHNAAQIKAAGRDMKAYVIAQQDRLAELTAAVASAESIEAVEALAWTQG